MCFCSNITYGKYGKALSQLCQTSCSGDVYEICGGNSTNSIYKTSLSIIISY
jgi:hypothetical protein